MDDQGNNAYTSWGPEGDNNIVGQFTSPATLAPVADIAPGIIFDAIPQMLIEPFRESLIETPWSTIPPPLIDPLLVVTGAAADGSHLVTVDWDSTVVSDLVNADVFMEVEQSPGEKVRFAGPVGVDLSVPASYQDTFSVPLGQDYQGKDVIVVARSVGSGEEFESPGFTMIGLNFDNTVTPVPAPTLTGPTISSVVADVVHGVTLEGNAGPGTLGVSRVSVEVFLGGDQLYVYEDPVLVDLTLAQPLTLVFTVPAGLNFNGKNIVLVARGTGANSGFKFESAPTLMSGANFDNSSNVTDPAFINPNAQVINIQVSLNNVAVLEAEAGPTDAPFVTVRWEADLDTNVKVVLLEMRDELMSTRRTFSDSVPIPPTLNLQGSDIRFVVVPQTGLVVEV